MLDAVLVSASVRKRLQASASGRNRLQPFARDRRGRKLSCLLEKLHNASLSGSFSDVASFRVAGVALCGIWTCDRRAATVAESCCAYWKSCKRCHFCRVFCKNRIGMAARSGDRVQIPWQAWHFVTCDEIWRKPRTKHRF